jgi:hypothetical protein
MENSAYEIDSKDDLLEMLSSSRFRILDSIVDDITIALPFENRSTIIIEYRNENGLWGMRLVNIRKYYIYYENDISQLEIVRIKAFRESGGFYLSLDPYDDIGMRNVPDERDNLVICAESVSFVELHKGHPSL